MGVMAAPVLDEVAAAGDAQWLARLRAAEIESRMAQARVLQIIGERDAVGVAGRSGYGTVARMVAAVALIGAGEARNRVAAGEALAPRQTLIGETLPARCPATAAAFAAGQISAAGVRIVTELIGCSYTTGYGQCTTSRTRRNLLGWAGWCGCGVGVGGSAGGDLLSGVECSG